MAPLFAMLSAILPAVLVIFLPTNTGFRDNRELRRLVDQSLETGPTSRTCSLTTISDCPRFFIASASLKRQLVLALLLPRLVSPVADKGAMVEMGTGIRRMPPSTILTVCLGVVSGSPARQTTIKIASGAEANGLNF